MEVDIAPGDAAADPKAPSSPVRPFLTPDGDGWHDEVGAFVRLDASAGGSWRSCARST